MKLAGMFLLLAGWGIVLGAMVLFPHQTPRNVFMLAGLCLEAVGVALFFRGHAEREPEAR